NPLYSRYDHFSSLLLSALRPLLLSSHPLVCSFSFFFNDTATTEIYTLSLHDALPIYQGRGKAQPQGARLRAGEGPDRDLCDPQGDRKSTRLNSSHVSISYAVFCLKKKKKKNIKSQKAQQ